MKNLENVVTGYEVWGRKYPSGAVLELTYMNWGLDVDMFKILPRD